MSARDTSSIGASAWARHLMAPVVAQQASLPLADAQRVQRLHDQLLAALQARDRSGLRSAKQAVLDAALTQPGSPALRSTLRALAWRMVALRPASESAVDSGSGAGSGGGPRCCTVKPVF
ncbi:MAG: hypothetical protein ACTS5V_09540 [Giesbergeria sp.]